MKVALFVPSLGGGGAERVMVNLARGLAESGLAVDLVLASAEGPLVCLVPPEVRIVDLQASRVLASLPSLVRYLRSERPQVLLSALDHANVVAICAKGLARVPTRVVVSVHTTLSEAFSDTRNLRGRLVGYFVPRIYPLADAAVAVSQGVAEDLICTMGIRQAKVRVIHNPVVTPELFARASEPLDHPWFAPENPPVVLGVGNLRAAKDFATLIRGFALLRKKCPARLMILGEGQERPKLEALARDLGIEKHVALPGFARNPYNYMKHASVFVLSSRREGLPTVLIEAMALGTPVVSTDCRSGPREILEGGKWGTLVPCGDPEELAKAILATPKKPVSTFARLEPFTLEHATAQYLELLMGG